MVLVGCRHGRRVEDHLVSLVVCHGNTLSRVVKYQVLASNLPDTNVEWRGRVEECERRSSLALLPRGDGKIIDLVPGVIPR